MVADRVRVRRGLRRLAAGAGKTDDATRAALDADLQVIGLPFEVAWLKVCIDGEGTVTSVHAREVTSGLATDAFAYTQR